MPLRVYPRGNEWLHIAMEALRGRGLGAWKSRTKQRENLHIRTLFKRPLGRPKAAFQTKTYIRRSLADFALKPLRRRRFP